MSEAPDKIKRVVHEKNIVPEGGSILFHEKQKRILNWFFPAHILLTENQAIKYKPSLIGHETETRPIKRINDIDVSTGLLSDTISIQSRELDDFEMKALPKNSGNELRNTIYEMKE